MDAAVSLAAIVGLLVLAGALTLVTRRSGIPLRSRGQSPEEIEREYLQLGLERHEADLRKQGYTDEDIAKELQKKREDLVTLAPEIEARMRDQGFTDAQIENALRVAREVFPAGSVDDPYAPGRVG